MYFILIMFQVQQKLQTQSSPMDFKDYASFTLAIVGLVTLIFGLFQYRKSLLQKRSEQFLIMRSRYVDNTEFQELFSMLEIDDVNLIDIPYKRKLKILGFYEELALMVNSKLIKKEVAFYMFAYHAIRIWGSKYFWTGRDFEIDKSSIYWSLFKKFALDMIDYQQSFILRMKNENKIFSILKPKFRL